MDFMRPETTSSFASLRSRRLRLVALAACLLALGCTGQAPATAPTTPVTSAAVMPMGTLDGRVMLPEEAVGPSHVIPTGIGRVIPTGQGRYRVAAVEDELPVTGADVAAYDPTSHRLLGTTRTDGEGRFKLAGLATGRNVLVQVTAPVDDATFHLLALARPAEANAAVAVSWRSTAVVASLLHAPNTDLATYPPTAEAEAEAALAQQVAAKPPAERTTAIVGAITQAATSVLLPTPAPSASVSTSLPSAGPLPSTGLAPVDHTVASTVPAVTGAIGSTVPAVTQTVDTAVQTTAPQLQTVVSNATTAAATTTQAVTTTTTQAVTGTVGTVTSILSSAPSPSPTPSPTPSSLLGTVISHL